MRKGWLVARTLQGSWRTNPDPLDISESELDEVTPLLCSSGAAALGWRRVSNSPLRSSASAEVLHQTFRLQSLQWAMQEQKIEKVFRLLRQASLEAILAKGWRAARMYPLADIRPGGDIDICVRPGQFKLTEEVLSAPEANDCWVDLHSGFSELADRPVDDLFKRSIQVALGSEPIRVLSDEDHLALLCIHLLKHGAWRPLWLVDVAVAIETLPPNFNWDACLGRSKRRAHWIISAITLAEHLLDANTEKVPAELRMKELPAWFIENVLTHWAHPFVTNQAPMSHPVPMTRQLKDPRGLLNGLRARWPDPILATVSVNGSFNRTPRFPYQVANCVSRFVRFALRMAPSES